MLISCSVHRTAVIGGSTVKQEISAADNAAEHVWDFRDASTWLLGDMKIEWLMRDPHYRWYSKEYADYNPDPQFIEQLFKSDVDGMNIVVVLGTWCPDSRREVPRFMKVIDVWGFPVEKIRFIGVDIEKSAPLDDFVSLAVERVPTFIFYKNNIELGRIIELPVTSLEQDMVKILNEK